VILQLSALTLEVIGSKWSYALKWCKLNNDDDDDDDECLSSFRCHLKTHYFQSAYSSP